MPELSDALHARIVDLTRKGDELAAETKYAEALGEYLTAWDILPEPKEQWEAATWILAAIGDANFLSHDFEAGRDNLSAAMRCPDAIGNPFLHLRLGQCQFELGVLDRAADELARAYMAEGKELFADEDPKYFDFLKKRLDHSFDEPRG